MDLVAVGGGVVGDCEDAEMVLEALLPESRVPVTVTVVILVLALIVVIVRTVLVMVVAVCLVVWMVVVVEEFVAKVETALAVAAAPVVTR
jgi:hypothetical protein